MDGDWETVKAKPKAAKKPKAQEKVVQYGGKSAHGTLTAGPIKKVGQQNVDYSSLNNQATNIADFDYHVDDEYYEEVKFETVSHACAQSIAEARMAKNLTQEKLALAAGEKLATIKDYENGTGRYNGATINKIEKALGCKINRARNKK